MAEQLADGHREPLRRRIHRGVCGKPVDVKRFEADPHRVRRIGEAAVGERVGHQQVAEFVVNAGNRDGQQRQDRNSNDDD